MNTSSSRLVAGYDSGQAEWFAIMGGVRVERGWSPGRGLTLVAPDR